MTITHRNSPPAFGVQDHHMQQEDSMFYKSIKIGGDRHHQWTLSTSGGQ
jgi:hypothetical protein